MKKFIVVTGLLLLFAGCGSDTPVIQNEAKVTSALSSEVVLEQPRVEVLEGIVKVQLVMGGEAKTVDKELALASGQQVIVEEGGLAQLFWPDGSISRMKGPAQVEIDKVSYSSDGIDTNVEIEVQSGEVWTKVLDMLSNDSSVTVHTPHTVAGVRGTAVYHNVTSQREIVRAVEHGVDVQLKGVPEEKEPPRIVMEEEEVVYTKGNIVLRKSKDDTPWIGQMQELDQMDLVKLEKRRLEQLKSILEKNKEVQTNDNDLTRGSLLKQLDMEIVKYLAHEEKEDTEAALKKLQTLFEKAHDQIPEEYQDEVAKRIELYKKLVFATGTKDDDIKLRAQLITMSLQFRSEEERKKVAEKLMLREMFFLNDLQKKQRKEHLDEVINTLTEIADKDVYKERADTQSKMFFKIMTNIERDEGSMKGKFERVKKKLEGIDNNENTNQEVNTNINAGVIRPEVERITPSTNSNMNVSLSKPTNTNTTLIKNTNTNTNPTPVVTQPIIEPTPSTPPVLAPESEPVPVSGRNVFTSTQ